MRCNWLLAMLLGVTLVVSGCSLEDDVRERMGLADRDRDNEGDDNDATGDTGDDDPADDIAGDALACQLAEHYLAADLPESRNTAANRYEDMSFVEWCLENVDRPDLEDFVGNAAAWEADEDDALITATSFTGRATRAYPAHGARLKLNVLDPRGTLPFARKIHFADWQGEADEPCALEMRVYQQDIGESGKRPLLYLHGGGWRNRTTTFTAAEVLVTQLVESHVVFMPAYPLLRDSDGPETCRNADFEDILDTAQAAFEWVQQNMRVFGVPEGSKLDVMGHSAGGQLSAWLATQNRSDVGKFLNFYGPTEFADFIDEAREGGLYEDDYAYSKRTIAYLLGVDDIADLERPYDDIVMQNSLSEIVAAEGAGALPPFMMVQGNEDTTVPVEQAVISCNAIGGNAATEAGTYECGSNGSRAVIIDNAGHNLDKRCVTGVFPASAEASSGNQLDDYCPTDPADKSEVRDAVASAYEWLREER